MKFMLNITVSIKVSLKKRVWKLQENLIKLEFLKAVITSIKERNYQIICPLVSYFSKQNGLGK